MTKENEAADGLKFNVNDGGAGKKPEPENKKEEKLEEEKDNGTIKNTARGTRGKN